MFSKGFGAFNSFDIPAAPNTILDVMLRRTDGLRPRQDRVGYERGLYRRQLVSPPCIRQP